MAAPRTFAALAVVAALAACSPSEPASISARPSPRPELGADRLEPSPPPAEPTPPPEVVVAAEPSLEYSRPLEPSPRSRGDASVLACLRAHEGDYTTETGNGYSGAYQYAPATWAWAAAGAADVAQDLETAKALRRFAAGPASAAPPWAQDAATSWALDQPGGAGNWPTMRYCR